jgi:TonB family protein
MYLIGDASAEERQHADTCTTCRAEIEKLATSLSEFRGAVRNWSEQAGATEPLAGRLGASGAAACSQGLVTRSSELHWTVIPATDHLERLLAPASLEMPWYRSLWRNLADAVRPAQLPPLDVTARPVLVREIWGQYGRQKKSWAMSVALQSAVVALLFTVFSTKAVQMKMVELIPLMAPLSPYQPAKTTSGGGGGGDRSPLPASKGKPAKPALKQFTPPEAVVHNLDPKLSVDPTILAPPDVALPQVNMAQLGDPLAKLGPASNGPGSGGGIGSGADGGIGTGKGPGFGPGNSGGVGGGVFRAGGGVTAPSLLSKVEPEYSEEARKAKYQGTVSLYVEIDPSGRATNPRVVHSLGLGLDEKAIEAVRRWKFRPGYKDGKPVTVSATIEVNFRLL